MKSSLALLPVLVFLLVSGCDQRSDYEKLVDRELAKNVRYDELFLGYELGMSKNEFYDHSWELNRKGLVKQGPQNQTVEYVLDDELPHSAKMNYYPDFHDEKIFRMRVYFKYDGWAPWNKNLSSDSLLTDVVELFGNWYGDDFIKIEQEENEIEYVKVDGNRKISVTTYRDNMAIAFFTDLLIKKEDNL